MRDTPTDLTLINNTQLTLIAIHVLRQKVISGVFDSLLPFEYATNMDFAGRNWIASRHFQHPKKQPCICINNLRIICIKFYLQMQNS